MRPVYISANNIISPLGFNSEINVANIEQEKSGISLHTIDSLSDSPFYASIINNQLLEEAFQKITDGKTYTKLEKMMILSLHDTIAKASFTITDKTVLVISTTKGNIDVLEKNSPFSEEQAYLPVLGTKIKNFFQFKNEPIIVSNACVSGILSVAIAKRFIQSNFYDNAFIVSGDIVSKFILSGFNSFQAISNTPCLPFSKNRKGITIGEAAASVAISSVKDTNTEVIKIIGDGSCNDANHISGPSRTGEGLYRSIQSAINETTLNASDIDYISAHGTATSFNDEMEAIALNRCNLSKTPVNSLKGFYGHTLGSSGLLETIIGIHSIKNNTLYTSLGFDELGVSMPLNIIQKTTKKTLNTFLKTASGFGGCNTAVLFKKL
ncbi:beta-ketoacyl synthase N-terminal-like domain-containing protein [Polaribacter sp.]|uniref:beta-ketoacyl synthase N-terminal-like domain-containing protein n=1 Tax=Polaribacter sp. TaxID=1920175 RepID=UPI003EF0BFE7